MKILALICALGLAQFAVERQKLEIVKPANEFTLFDYELGNVAGRENCTVTVAEPTAVITCGDGYLGFYSLKDLADPWSVPIYPDKFMLLAPPGAQNIKPSPNEAVCFTVDTGELVVTEFVGTYQTQYYTNVYHLQPEPGETEYPLIMAGYLSPQILAV